MARGFFGILDADGGGNSLSTHSSEPSMRPPISGVGQQGDIKVIRTFSFLASATLVFTAGCTATSMRAEQKPARLSFATVGTVKGFLGSFRTLDGKPIEGTPVTVEIPAGRHRIGYWCPDQLVMDGPPTLSVSFQPGGTYVLHCDSNKQDHIEKR